MFIALVFEKLLRKSTLIILLLHYVSASLLAQSISYVLEINNLQKVKSSKKHIYFKFDLNNTGDADIELPYLTLAQDIDFRFENNSQEFQSYHKLILEKLAKMSLVIATGTVKSDVQIKLPIQKKEVYKNLSAPDTLNRNDSLQLDTIKYSSVANLCPDLIIDSIWIVNKNRNKITIAANVLNVGNYGIRVWGIDSTPQDNIVMKAFLATHEHITKSSFMLRGLYIQDEVFEFGGILGAKQKMNLIMELSLKQKTKFTPYIILEINSLRTETECNFDNNTKAKRLD